jgi:hypothetical protein
MKTLRACSCHSKNAKEYKMNSNCNNTDKIEVSILLAGLGDLSHQIQSIKNANATYNYELIVCSDLKQNGCDVFLPDTGTSVSAYNEMFKISKGSYIICLPGTVAACSNLFIVVDMLKRKEEAGEKIILTSSNPDGHYCLIPPWAAEAAGLPSHPRPQIIRFPAFSRKTIYEHFDGVIFAESFKHHWVDNWLGTYCALIGENVKESVIRNINTLPHTSITKDDAYDRKIYEKLCESFKNDRKYNIMITI